MRRIITLATPVIALGLLLLQGCQRGEPWSFRFERSSGASLRIVIDHAGLAIHGAAIETNVAVPNDVIGKTALIQRSSDLPVGKVLFTDLTSLPGRIRFELGKHVIDVMPRTIIIDGSEVSWPKAMQAPIQLDSR